MKNDSVGKLPPLNSDGTANVIVETPKGHRNKLKYDEEHAVFKLSGVLAAGHVFPYDFGFLPGTQGSDGDPLDVLVMMDEPVFPGCLVPTRLIGVIEAEQTGKGETTRNDRLIGVATDSHEYRDVRTLEDLNAHLLDEVEHFFISYNQVKGKEFRPLGRFGPERAEKLVRDGMRGEMKRSRGRKAA